MKKLNIVSFGPEDFIRNPIAGLPSIRIHTSRITISAVAVDLTGLKDGDKVKLHQNQDEPAIWYLTVDPKGFAVKRASSSKALSFYSKDLALTIMQCFEKEEAFSMVFQGESVLSGHTRFWPMFLPAAEGETIQEQEQHQEDPPAGNQNKKRRGRKPGSKNKKKEEGADDIGLPTLADIENPY